MKYIALPIALLLSCYVCTGNPTAFKIKAEKIVGKLYDTNGNYTRGAAPDIIIIEGQKGGASYHPGRHTIELDMALIELCNSFGEQAEDALAYILGHELAHSYQKKLRQTSFWEYYLHKGCTKNEEREADIFGVFNAYLAGYKTVKIVPAVIGAVYQQYELRDQISGYPPKGERMKIAKQVQAKVEELIKVYEAANYLTAIGKYDLAAASYQHILKFYQGREIYNNLGVNYTLQAMNFTDKDYDLYLYPLELDWLTRMKKPKIDRGGEPMSPEEQQYRNRLLTQALYAFDQAGKLDRLYFTAKINALCVKTLMGVYLPTIRQCGILTKNGKASITGATQKQIEKVELIAAIAQAHIGPEKQTALQIWAALEQSAHQEIAYQAAYNRLVLEEGECNMPDEYSCREPFPSQGRVNGVMLHRVTRFEEDSLIDLDDTDQIKLAIETYAGSVVFRYFSEGKPHCSLQQIFKPKKTSAQPGLLEDGIKLKVLTTNTGYLLACTENRSVFLMSSENQPVEWGKYYLH